MHGLDETIAGLAQDHGLLAALAVALLLGLRHATDPDHLAAVSTLIAGEPQDGVRRAGRLGIAWGLGHATTLLAFGLPVVLLGAFLPEPVQQGAELLVGLVIMALAVRLLVRWRHGRYHAHQHRHGELVHRHLHPHGHGAGHAHAHRPEAQLGRTPLQAYGIGLLHGAGGSAGVGVLVLAGIPDRAQAAVALVCFALAAAASMAALSCGIGYALTRGDSARRPRLALTPALATATLLFGAWYAFTAVAAPA